MVVPAEKIHEVLTGFASEEEIEANDVRRRKKAQVIRVGDTTPQPNVTIGKVASVSFDSPKD